MNKKGVEMTFQTIVVAAILLLVMIVVIVIFSKGMDSTNETTEKVRDGMSCEDANCKSYTYECPDDKTMCIGNFKELRENKVCCK